MAGAGLIFGGAIFGAGAMFGAGEVRVVTGGGAGEGATSSALGVGALLFGRPNASKASRTFFS